MLAFRALVFAIFICCFFALSAGAQTPANDDFADRLDLGSALPSATSGSTIAATNEPDEPEAEEGTGSIWWQWQAPETGVFRVSMSGSEHDSQVSVWIGDTLGSLERVSAGKLYDPEDYFSDNRLFRAVEGEIFQLRVSAELGELGLVSLSITRSELPEIISMSVSPDVVTMSGDTEHSIIVNVEITSPLGLDHVNFGIRDTNGELAGGDSFYGNGFGELAPRRVSGDSFSGNYRFEIPIESYRPSGVWKVEVHAGDNSGLSLGFPETLGYAMPVDEADFTVVNTGAVDLLPPTLDSITFEPAIVDVAGGETEVVINVVASDDAGVRDVTVRLSKDRSGLLFNPDYDLTLERVSGDQVSGAYRGVITMPEFAKPQILIPSVEVRDVRYRYSYFSGDSIPDGSDTALEVINEGVIAGAPTLVSLTVVPTLVDITDGRQTLNFTLKAAENILDFSSGTIGFNADGRTYSVRFDSDDEFSDSVFEGTWVIPQFIAPGSYPLWVTLSGGYSETVRYGFRGQEPIPEGSDMEIEISNDGEIDADSPFLTKLTFSPQIVDIGEGMQTALVRVEAGDDLDLVSVDIELQDDSYRLQRLDLTLDRVSGDSKSGVYEGVIEIPALLDPFEFLPTITLVDRVGNVNEYRPYEISRIEGSDATLEVLNTGVRDLPPATTNVTIIPSVVDVSDGPASVSVRIEASDDFSEIAEIDLSVVVGEIPLSLSIRPDSQTEPGVYEATWEIPSFLSPGRFPLRLFLKNDKGETAIYDIGDNPLPDGSSDSLTIENRGRVDSEPPELSLVEFDPAIVDATDSNSVVAVRVGARDDTGITSLTLILSGGRYPYVSVPIDVGGIARLISGDAIDGVYEAIFNVPSGIFSANYNVTVIAKDSVGNEQSFSSLRQDHQPLPEGAPDVFVVTNSDPLFTQKPEILSFSATPTIVDVTDGEQFVSVVVETSDILFGVNEVYVGVDFGAFNAGVLIQEYFQTVPGQFTGRFTIPRNLPSGTYPYEVSIYNQDGGLEGFQQYGADFLPFPEGSTGTITIINDGLTDLSPPEITEFSISPPVVDVSERAQIVSLRVVANDDVGVSRVTLGENYNRDGILGLDLDAVLVSGDASAGVWEGRIEIPVGTVPGTWALEATATDGLRQSIRFPGEIASDGDESVPTLTVINSVDPPNAPSLKSITITPPVLDLTDGGGDIEIRVEVEEETSRVTNITFETDLGIGVIEASLENRGGAFSQIAPGVFHAKIFVPPHVPPGRYPSSLEIAYGAVDSMRYGIRGHDYPGGLATDLTILNRGVVDRSSPAVVSTVFSTNEIDVATGDQELGVTVVATDDLGVESVEISLQRPGYGQRFLDSFRSDLSANRVSGDARSGVYEGTVAIPGWARPGILNTNVTLRDIAGRRSVTTLQRQLHQSGTQDGVLEIINSNVENAPLALVDLSLSPSNVDFSTGISEVLLQVAVAGGDEYIDQISVTIGQGMFYQSFLLDRSYEKEPGVFERNIALRPGLPPGEHELAVSLINSSTYRTFARYGGSYGQPFPEGLPSFVTVSGGPAPEPESLMLKEISFDPPQLDFSADSQDVTVQILTEVSDPISHLEISLSRLNYSYSYSDLVFNFAPGSSRELREVGPGLFEGVIQIPAGTDPGVFWAYVDASDTQGRFGSRRYRESSFPVAGVGRLVINDSDASFPHLALKRMSVTPRDVDVTGADQTVKVRVEVEGDLPDLESVEVSGYPFIRGLNSRATNFRVVAPGILEADWIVSSQTESGQYYLQTALSGRSAGAVEYGINSATPIPEGSTNSITVTNRGSADDDFPELAGLSFVPNPIARDRLPAVVTVIAGAMDFTSGISRGDITLLPFPGSSLGYEQFSTPPLLGYSEFKIDDLVEGDTFAGVYESDIQLDRLPEGSRIFTSITLRDGGQRSLYAGDAFWEDSALPPGTEPLMVVDSYNDSYDAWISQNSAIPASVTSPTADADGDGFPNGIEFYLGMDPMADSNGSDQVPRIVFMGEQFGLRVPVDSANLAMDGRTLNATPVAQWSSNGQSWQDIPAPEIVDGAMTFLTPADADKVKLMRFVVEFAPPLEMN